MFSGGHFRRTQAGSRKLMYFWMTCVAIMLIGMLVYFYYTHTKLKKIEDYALLESSEDLLLPMTSSLVYLTQTYSVQTDSGQDGSLPQEIIDRINAGDTEGLKVVFLTFDDGPSERTEALLNILDQYQVKATFFTNEHAESDTALYQEIVNRGHTLGNHTTSHDYTLYDDPQAFIDSVNTLSTVQTEAIGSLPSHLFRFPGGSLSSNQTCIDEVLAEGYNYVDWNVSSGDGASTTPEVEVLAANILNGVHNHDVSVVLAHPESHDNTMEALPGVIEQLLSEGYTFYRMDDSITNYPRQM